MGRVKRSVFRQVTGTKKQIFMVMICTYGLEKNKHSIGLIDNVLIININFIEISRILIVLLLYLCYEIQDKRIC